MMQGKASLRFLQDQKDFFPEFLVLHCRQQRLLFCCQFHVATSGSVFDIRIIKHLFA